MSDGTIPDDDVPPLASPEPVAEVELDVKFVFPAPAYHSIATDDELGQALEAPPDRGGPGSEAVVAAVEALGDLVNRRLDGLQTLFDREIRAEATREKVVDRLHAELQDYKNDLLLKVLRPVFVDLIQLHDDIGKMVEAQGEGAADVRRLLEMMSGFQQGIEDILYRQGVEPFVLDSDTFDPRRQRAVATVPTDNPVQNKKVAARHRKGFQAGEKLVRPEIVSVYSLKR